MSLEHPSAVGTLAGRQVLGSRPGGGAGGVVVEKGQVCCSVLQSPPASHLAAFSPSLFPSLPPDTLWLLTEGGGRGQEGRGRVRRGGGAREGRSGQEPILQGKASATTTILTSPARNSMASSPLPDHCSSPTLKLPFGPLSSLLPHPLLPLQCQSSFPAPQGPRISSASVTWFYPPTCSNFFWNCTDGSASLSLDDSFTPALSFPSFPSIGNT